MLILVTEISPKGMSAILDEVRAETDFQHFLLHTLKRRSVVLGLKFGELLFRRTLQDPVHIGLHNSRKVFRVVQEKMLEVSPARTSSRIADIRLGKTLATGISAP